jgi:serine/threonine protein kinase/WD40 repeat protein
MKNTPPGPTPHVPPPSASRDSSDEKAGSEKSLERKVRELRAEAVDVPPSSSPAGHDDSIGAELARLKPEEPGDRIGSYKLLQQIGEGGFGVVWMAEQQQPVKRRVALKIIKLGMDTKEVIARFEQERQALAMMDHPNIAHVLDAGATPFGRPFFVMELVRGIKITEYCDQANLPMQDRLQLFVSVCRAVQHAHQKGIIHRDLKPSNILVTLHDGVPVPKVIDFGVAKAMQSQQLTELTLFTQFQQMVGTPLYMSPEQAEMSGLDIDTRSDIYSLGVVLYELLTGRTPFDPDQLMKAGHDEMRRVIREEEPLKPSTFLSTLTIDVQGNLARHRQSDRAKLIGQIRGDLDWIVMKALEKDRTRRYETANGLAMDIQRHLADEPVLARPPSQLYRFRRLVRRNKAAFAATAAVATALIIGLTVAVGSYRRERKQRVIADEAVRTAVRERAVADEQRQLAKANAAEANQNALRARRLLYAADIALAQQSLDSSNLGRARRLLDRHRPAEGEKDLRGWEWRWLWQQCRAKAVTLTRHTERAFTTSFSADGDRLAVAYMDGRIEVWDVRTRTLLKVVQTRGDGPIALFAPNADALVFTGPRRTLTWYDFANASERPLCTVPGAVRDVAFSADGSRIVVLTRQTAGLRGQDEHNAALVIDVNTSEVLTTIPLPEGGAALLNNARISPDHQLLYVTCAAFRDPQLRCIRLRDETIVWQSNGRDTTASVPFTGFSAMDLSPDGKFLATAAGYDQDTVQIWNAETGERIANLKGHTRYIMRLSFSRDGRILASGSSDESIRLWDTHTWKALGTPLRGHSDEVHAVAFSPTAQLLATGSKDGEVMLWDEKARADKEGRQALPADIRVAHLLPGGRRVLAIAESGASSVIELATLRRMSLPFPAESRSWFIPPNFVGVYDRKKTLQLFEITDANARLLAEVEVGAQLAALMAFCPKNKLLAWNTQSPGIQIARIDAPQDRMVLTSADNQIELPLRFDPDGDFLLAASQQTDRARVWELASRRRLPAAEDYFRFNQAPGFARYFNNARNNPALPSWIDIAVAQARASPSRGGENMPEPKPDKPEEPSMPEGFWPPGSFTSRSVSPDGRTFAICTENGLVGLYDASTKAKLGILHGRLHAVFSCAFSPDGTRLAVAHDTLWDVETRQELLNLDAEGDLHHLAEFSDDGNTFLIGSTQRVGTFQFWTAPSWQEIEEAERQGGVWPHAAE